MQLLRVFRLARVFRVLKLGHRSHKLQIVGRALLQSTDVVLMLSFLLGLAILVFSALIFEAERRQFAVFDPALNSLVRASSSTPQHCRAR